MECERIRASAVWRGPAVFVGPEAGQLPRDDGGYTTGSQAGQPHYYYLHQQHVSAGGVGGGPAELWDGCNYKGYGGGGDDFSVDDLLDLGDGGGAEEAAATADNAAGCQGGGCWGKGTAGSSDSNSNSDVASEPGVTDTEPLVPQVGDITDLEWVSQFVDDSYTYAPPCPAVAPAYVVKPEPQQRLLQFVPNPTSAGHSRSPSAGSVASITSPVAGVCSLSLKRPWSSALEDPLSAATAGTAPCRKVRSKRLRTDAGARAWASSAGYLLQEPLCSSASSSSSCSSTSSSFSSRCFLLEQQQPYGVGPFEFVYPAPRPRGRPPLHKKKHLHSHSQAVGGELLLPVQLQREKSKQKKKKGRKPKPSFGVSSFTATAETDEAAAGTGRRCSHCGVQKTPQWRAGPMGAKTLCNACGVRYKSGRLLPEYRPACSPTFMSHVHSNSHRKVLEMRRNKEMLVQQQEEQQEQLLAFSASAAAVVAVAASAPPPPEPIVTAQAMPAQQMVC